MTSLRFLGYSVISLFFLSFSRGAEPFIYEPLDSLKTQNKDIRLENVTEVGPGKVGDAVLLESRTKNLLQDSTLTGGDSQSWILMGDSKHTKGGISLGKDGMVRQVISDVKADSFCCFSVYARAQNSNNARITMEWAGATENNSKEFEIGKDWIRLWVGGRLQGGTARASVK